MVWRSNSTVAQVLCGSGGKARTSEFLVTQVKGKQVMAYNLIDQATGRVLDSNFDKNVYTSQPNGGQYQQWVLYSGPNGNIFAQDVATGLFLDGNGTNVYTNPYNGGTFQQWELQHPGGFQFVLKHVESGQVLDSNADGNVYFNSANGGNFQHWLLNNVVTEEELRSQLKAAPPVPALPR